MSKLNRATRLALAISIALGTSPSFAEETESSNAEKEVERIAVVGTRSAPRSVAESPVPVDIVGADELGKNASTDMLDQLQAAVPSFAARAQPISDAASFIRPINLRGLSSDSTLILVNGKRRHRASVIAFQGGGVNDGAQGPDISVIPSIALKQVEVLRDGAAAQYGSDAIAGVMNFVLKDDADGGSISVRRGEYGEGDGAATTVDGNIGLPFTKYGFANLSFQYKTADATSRSVQRNDALALSEAGNTHINDPAMVWGNPEIDDDITVFANVGLDLGDDKQFYMFGNYSERTATGGYYYRNPQNRGGVFSKDVSDFFWDPDGDGEGNTTRKVWLVGDLQGLDSSGNSISGCPIDVTLVDYVNNTSVPNILDTSAYQQVANNNNCWAFNQLLPGGYTPQFTGDINDTSLTMGVDGEFKSGFLDGWFFDLSGGVGRNESEYTLRNTVNPSMGPEQGDLSFKTGSYVQLEKTFNFDINKTFDWGLEDDASVAMGIEWREESFEIKPGERASWDSGVLASQGFSVGSHGFAGFSPESQGTKERRSFAAYVDVEAQMTDDFLLGGALRYEDFDSFGATTNYKITAQYQLTDNLSVRGSHSTGFRAPTVGQANVVNTQTSFVEGELVQSATFPPTNPLSMYYGGKELEPEESKSFAAGLVYQQGDFFLTADIYQIEVTDRIQQTDKFEVTRAVLDQLGIEDKSISSVTFFANDFDTTTNGLDIVANYSMQLFGGDTAFALAYNFNETEVDRFSDATGEVKVRRLEEGIPEHRGTLTMSQSWDDISMFIRGNYYGEYWAVHADDGGASADADAAVTFDAEISYFFSDSWTLSAGANNIFDQEAEELPYELSEDYAGAMYFESGPFDYNGAFYYVKATYKF
ncbi:TonB-dependent receptor [Thalassotalea sp. 1_MG-2023]|uniref:TonB-dependent receptor plug domain-containing protein n=1 Tax=Thalassotalea sp. 1_MG-2023 TaxID=3062680 RepID=UPI0026E3E2D9|nr:TonB-dependent receptor [Thalassotalea sp. 1_MG-2023]MDO6428372.1 TonB-dependent receptor [Thalassotalea sp. 1_MG-2023]